MNHATMAMVMMSGFLLPVIKCVAEEAPSARTAQETAPHAVTVARTTAIPSCRSFVDAATPSGGAGTAQSPYKTIVAAIEAAQAGAVICVAEGTYAEELSPGMKYFTLAGGFQRGDFKVRDSATYVTKAVGNGGSFIRIEDPGPKGDQLTAIDGFEITGYSQAIFRDFYESQLFEITNSFIHNNICTDQSLAGAGFALNNVSGTIKGNVFASNSCGRGGAGFLNDTTNQNTMIIESNLIEGNAGTEPDSSHGGALYLFGNTLAIVGNTFTNNSVTQWGGGLYVGAYTQGNQPTTATLTWNVYRRNRAGDGGGGFFCDDGATCVSDHEVYYQNCGGNILVDGGSGGSGPTVAKFNHLTNYGALEPGCEGPGAGVFVDTYEGVAADTYSFTNAIFWGNAPARDFVTACDSGCDAIKVSVTHSMLQTKYNDGSIAIEFGEGNMAPADPLFVNPETGDFRLQVTSPAIAKGEPAGTDLGAYGKDGMLPAGIIAVEKGIPAKPRSGAKPSTEAKLSVATKQPAPAQDMPAENSVDKADEISVKQAFDDAKELGTVEAWNAFLANYPTGFHADLARAYLNKLGRTVPAAVPASPYVAEAPALTGAAAAPTQAPMAAVARGAEFMGFAEKFNRYYTDPSWQPTKIVYVSPDGGGDGANRDSPMSVQDAAGAAKPGTEIYFLRGNYQACFEFTKESSGTYDQPIVLYAERNDDKSIGVSIKCCNSGRQTCFNLEDADYIALDGFELIGGKYGVRAVGGGYPASEHSRGIAVIECNGHDQDKDPFFSGQSDWNVWESNVAYGAKKGDGHGIYLSNGSDWNIVRFNETYGNLSSDFQVNADPNSACKEMGIPFDDPRCDDYAGEGEGGQGASDYFLVDGNYFHHGLAQGPNFTSVRRSVVRNNIFGPQARHNVSFWQETDNPKLGSSDNKIINNLFVTTDRPAVQFINNSTRNQFANNVILGVQIGDGKVMANPSAVLMEVDDTVGENVYRANLYVSGTVEGRSPDAEETTLADFSSSWFANFPADVNHDPNDFTPTAEAPFLGIGRLAGDAPSDRNGSRRPDEVDLGPIELR